MYKQGSGILDTTLLDKWGAETEFRKELMLRMHPSVEGRITQDIFLISKALILSYSVMTHRSSELLAPLSSKSPSLGWGKQPHIKACIYQALGEGNCKDVMKHRIF